jgi:pyruvate/2-oxoglutarate dehydrogenase complex dihydrolipoamide acyltransferase (E2) component
VALSDDQRAMLRLLAQREQGYDDIAALMGISVDDVRARVRDALAQLEEEGEPAPDLPPEPPRAPEPPPPSEPQPPPAPPEPPPKPAPPSAPAGGGSGRPKLSLPSGRGPLAAVGAAIAVIVVVALILIIGGGGSGDSSTTATTNASNAGAEESGEGQSANTAGGKQVTKAVLEPVGGGSASGVAIFGRVKNTLALQVQAQGLKPTTPGQSYAIWLAQSPQRMLPLAETPVGKTGRIGAQFEVPVEVLAYLANETFGRLAITLVDRSSLKAALAKATKEKKSPAYTGTEVLQGTVTGPIVGAANKQK